jgi:hypothetical protein
MSSRAKWEDMAREYVGTHGTATYTKTRPDTTKYVNVDAKMIPADKGSTVDTIREYNRKQKEETDKN